MVAGRSGIGIGREYSIGPSKGLTFLTGRLLTSAEREGDGTIERLAPIWSNHLALIGAESAVG